MRNTTFNHSFVSQTKLSNAESKNPANHYAAIALAACGGMFFLPLGFLMWVIFTVSGGNPLLNRAGVGSIIVGFIFFGLAAHFMDKADENKRSHKRQRIEKFNRSRLQ